MKLDLTYWDQPIDQAASFARWAEAVGADGIWVPETRHNPFVVLGLMAQATERLELGSGVAIAFARSPTVLAHLGWDLATLSRGRFILGLGTQVRAHIERRFGMSWTAPVPRLREMIQAIRAIWRAWQTGERLNYRGEHYKLTLMTPFFTPEPFAYHPIPIGVAGVNVPLIRLAGELADNFHLHPLHSRRYLVDVVRPTLAIGAARSQRPLAEISIVGSAFVITGYSEAERAAARESVRQQIAFYASTPSYRGVLACHGWSEVSEQLAVLARHAAWEEMAGLITDEMLAEFATEGAPDEIGDLLQRRYAGLVDRLSPYGENCPRDASFWRTLVESFH